MGCGPGREWPADARGAREGRRHRRRPDLAGQGG